jgi:plasmid stabilization system protein ParE
MKYSVIWSPRAEHLLAEIWMTAADRAAVTQSARDIDRLLETRPMDIGESRESGRRIYFSPPLGIAYSVRPDDLQVRVLRVWRVRDRA